MRLLVLGGTRFLGRAVVDEAVRRGYDVVTFNRGRSGDARPGTRAVTGDRTRPDDLLPLTKESFDGVVDTSMLPPAHVGAAARLLADSAAHYTYVSTLRVYRDWPAAPVDEESPRHDCPPDAAGELPYATRKAGAERAVERAMPGRWLFARSGIIVGPHESPARLPWWLDRFARGGQVPVPGPPDRPLRLVDARDLAVWVLDNTRRRIPGAVNIPGAAEMTWGRFVRTSTAVIGAGAEPVWVDDAALAGLGVRPWWQLPFWAPPGAGFGGAFTVADDRARLTGIKYRSFADTVQDTWRWVRQSGRSWASPDIGLDPAVEAALLPVA